MRKLLVTLAFLLLPSLVWASYATTILADGPAVFYALGESSGTLMGDQGSGANNGAYIGSPSLGQAGIPAGETAVLFNTGATKYGRATFKTEQIRNPGGVNRDWTAEAWVKFNSAANAYFMGNAATSSNYNWTCAILTTGSQFATFNTLDGTYGIISDTSASCTTAAYCYIVCEFTASPQTMFAYTNNNAGASTTSFTGTARVGSDLFYIGQRGDASLPLNGYVQYVAIYDFALSSGQRTAHYTAGLTAPTTGQFPFTVKRDMERGLLPASFGPALPHWMKLQTLGNWTLPKFSGQYR